LFWVNSIPISIFGVYASILSTFKTLLYVEFVIVILGVLYSGLKLISSLASEYLLPSSIKYHLCCAIPSYAFLITSEVIIVDL